MSSNEARPSLKSLTPEIVTPLVAGQTGQNQEYYQSLQKTPKSPHRESCRPTKRSRVRQACNGCKARKIKCGDVRPCDNCTTLGIVCKDWRPGQDHNSDEAAENPSTAPPPPSLASLGRISTSPTIWSSCREIRPCPTSFESRHVFHDPQVSHSCSSCHETQSVAGPSSRPSIPWPNTPYERSSHTVAWPPRPDPKRHRYLAYPYDSIYRNEFGNLKALTLTSGLGSLSYLHEYHKLANEQFLDALWQVLEADNQMFALENEIFSPHHFPGLNQQIDFHSTIEGFNVPSAPDCAPSGASTLQVPYGFPTEQANLEGNLASPLRQTTSTSSVIHNRSQPLKSTPSHNASMQASITTSTNSAPTSQPDTATSQAADFNPSKTSAAQSFSNQQQQTQNTAACHTPDDLWSYMDTQIPSHHRRSLIHTFLTTTYVLWPTFILSEFLAMLKDPVQKRDPTFVCLIIACCAIAARQEAGSRKGGAAAEWGKDFGCFELYLEIQRLAPKSTDWASLSYIQALYYLSHYCFGASGRPYGVHRGHNLINCCVSKCFDVGLHRSAETYTEAFTNSEIEARRRTLWAVYCGDKISAAYGKPVLLRLSDIDVPEIDIDSEEYNERLPAAHSYDRACNLRSWHRAAIRLFCVLERVIDKINLPACSPSAALERVMRKKPKRPRQTKNHDQSCMADHEPTGFHEKLELVDMFQNAETPTPTTAHQDDNMYHAHVERLRTTSAFIKMFIYRHLFCMANTNLSREPPRLDYRDEMVKWCRELLLSQRKMIQHGEYTDFGSVMSYQLSQTGRGLIPAIYISARLVDPGQDSHSAAIIKESQELLVLAYDLLRQLSSRFSASHRQLQIMQQAFKRLDLSLKKRHARPSGTGLTAQASGDTLPSSAVDGTSSTDPDAVGHTNSVRPAGTMLDMTNCTSGLDLIAGVAGAESLESADLVVSTQDNDEEDENEDYNEGSDKERKPGWISDLPINQPVEKTAPHTVNAFVLGI